MGPKKDRRLRKIEIPTDSVHKFEQQQISSGGGRRGRPERGRRHNNSNKGREGGKSRGITLVRGSC